MSTCSIFWNFYLSSTMSKWSADLSNLLETIPCEKRNWQVMLWTSALSFLIWAASNYILFVSYASTLSGLFFCSFRSLPVHYILSSPRKRLHQIWGHLLEFVSTSKFLITLCSFHLYIILVRGHGIIFLWNLEVESGTGMSSEPVESSAPTWAFAISPIFLSNEYHPFGIINFL